MIAQLHKLKRTPTVFVVELADLIYKVQREPVGQIAEDSHQAAQVLALIIVSVVHVQAFQFLCTYCKNRE